MLSLEEKVGQMMIVGFHGTEAPDYILEWLAAGRIGGVILFARNVENPTQIRALTESLHNVAKRPIVIAIDQEGGIVARLREGFTESPGAMALGAADSEDLAEDMSAVLGAEMRALGINWNLAPAIDLTHNIHNPSVGVRSLGVDAEKVKKLSVAQVKGFQSAGVAATAKHFPGKPDTPVDPHVSLPVIEGDVDEMWDTDLVPFRAVSDAGIAAMMITHVQFKSLEPEYPSTMSPKIIQGLLREKIGFEGVVSTDCMEMGAITKQYGPAESAVLAVLAGANTILFSHTHESQDEAYHAILEAVRAGRIPEATIDDAVSKIQTMKDLFSVDELLPLETIRCEKHLDIAQKTARAGTVLLTSERGVLPLKMEDERQIVLIEFASYLDTEALEDAAGKTGFGALLHTQLPNLQSVGINPGQPTEESLAKARKLAASAELVVLATRNAHLNTQQRELAQKFLDTASNSLLLCLRNPYDAGVLTGAKTILCSCGDSASSLAAMVDALTGQFTPTAKLPVPLSL